MSNPPLFTPALLSICLGTIGPAAAQTPAPDNRTATTTAATKSESRNDQRIEHIRIEDAGSRIDELRVGGQAQSITVSPKGGMPAYEVVPETANRGPATAERNGSGATGGTRVWKILGF